MISTIIETDLSRFISGRAYVLTRTVPNPKVDRRMRRGGPELAAHAELPKGLRFVLDVVERREDKRLVREYTWSADDNQHGGHYRYMRIKALDVTHRIDGRDVARHVYMLPHQEHYPEHHRVVSEVLTALELEPVSIESLTARAGEFYATGWDVIEHLIARGLISLSHVETSVDHLVGVQLSERSERIREHERTKEGQP